MQPFGENMSNIPAFLGKLWKIVNDPNTNHLICWSSAGNSFIIQNQAQFWYELLPLYYKHNNMSSFVRQLNMYGFHKMSTVENGTMDSDKDEIQFFHKYFHRDEPELLRNIKRKATVSKPENTVQNVMNYDNITKILTDVKHLCGRQSSVDTQLTAMKQENAVLWRELAILRQKHHKQQQIVNKLIQFLVTLVQPSASSQMGVGVKRRMPLMLHESPNKKVKNGSKTSLNNTNNIDNGPTIHELDGEIEISPKDLLGHGISDNEGGMVSNVQASVSSPSNTEVDATKPASVLSNEEDDDSMLSDDFWDKPEFVQISQISPDDIILSDNEAQVEDMSNNLSSVTNQNNEKIFLNAHSRNTLLSNIVNGSYNFNMTNKMNGKKVTNSDTKTAENPITTHLDFNNAKTSNTDMQVATRSNNGLLGVTQCKDDLDVHLETTQSEIDQLKDILKGCNSLDANALLGLFSDETPSYGLSHTQDEHNKVNTILHDPAGDPMVSGTELATCGNSLIDFNELFDDSLDRHDTLPLQIPPPESDNISINTPLIIKSEPIFPNLENDL